MLKLNGTPVALNHFTDGSFLLRQAIPERPEAHIAWYFEKNEELVALIFLTRHLKSHGVETIHLHMPYIPNARLDRVETSEDVFTLKYFAEIINGLGFASVTALDPHSEASVEFLDRLTPETPGRFIRNVIDTIGSENLVMFYPDEGAMERYALLADKPCAYGVKRRNWLTREIIRFDVVGQLEQIPGSRVLIVDDICSSGGTILRSARKLRELGADAIYLFVSHCENTVLDSELLASGLLERIFTTDSIYTGSHERITILPTEN